MSVVFRRARRAGLRVACVSLLAFAAPALAAPVTPMTPDVTAKADPVPAGADYERREVMIPMRDGVKLHTVILMKKGTRGGPILLSRTPYDASGSVNRTRSLHLVDVLPVMDADFVEDGYIRVYQDIRGLYGSEGQWVLNRPIAGPLNPTKIDESTDAFDTIDWLVKHVPQSNGKVGIIGSSYLGFTSLVATIHPHPALKAAVPQSPMVDGWMGDDWFHNGAFRVSSLDYLVAQSADKARGGANLAKGPGDDYAAYLAAGSMRGWARQWGIEGVPGVRKFLENPAYTAFWSGQAVDKWLAAAPVTVPTMLVVGQWDQEDSYGAPAAWRAMSPRDPEGKLVHLVIGPWRHSGVNHYGSGLGDFAFTGDTAREFRKKWLKPFLDHALKDAPDPHTPRVLTYATGENRWEASSRWPDGADVPLYLDAGGTASFTRPTATGHDDYLSDPAHPVPFVTRPFNFADGAKWQSWLVADQRFVDGRPDVATWQTAPLDKAVHVKGAPMADIHAATTGSDADWVVKLIDVAPDSGPEAVPEAGTQGAPKSMAGYEWPIGIEIFRGRYRTSFASPQPIEPGKVERYRFALPNVDHVFLPGHRIMVQVQSSLFPLYDRNPQSYVGNIMDAAPGDYRAATQSVWRGGETASAVVLPVAE